MIPPLRDMVLGLLPQKSLPVAFSAERMSRLDGKPIAFGCRSIQTSSEAYPLDFSATANAPVRLAKPRLRVTEDDKGRIKIAVIGAVFGYDLSGVDPASEFFGACNCPNGTLAVIPWPKLYYPSHVVDTKQIARDCQVVRDYWDYELVGEDSSPSPREDTSFKWVRPALPRARWVAPLENVLG